MSSLTSILIESKIQNINPFLQEIDKIINWDILLGLLDNIHVRDITLKGRKPYSKLIMLKAIMLQMWYNLSDVELENCLHDRLSFMKFCSLDLEDNVPDHSTICRFRNKLINISVHKNLLKEVNTQIEQHGVSLKSGAVVDASLINAHSRPRRKEYVEIEPTGDQKSSQKESEVKLIRVESHDPDARWLKKGKRVVYGYKGNISVDKESGLVQSVVTTSANVHDIKSIPALLTDLNLPDGSPILADKGYSSASIREQIRTKKWKQFIMYKRYKNDVCRELKIRFNKSVSKFRYIVEQTFGCLHQHLGFSRTPYVGLAKTEYYVTMKCLAFNLKRASKLIL